MDPESVEDILEHVPQAVARVDARLRVVWVAPGFEGKAGLVLQVGQCVLDILERGRQRDQVEQAIRQGQRFRGNCITCALHQVRVQVQPCRGSAGEVWLVVEPGSIDDPVAFAQALQEIARSVGEILDVDAVCAAAVMSMVRCAHVSRAEVFLMDERHALRRVAVSDLAGSGASRERPVWMEATLKQALATGETQIGITRGPAQAPSIYAAIPLCAQKRTLGLLMLHKAEGAAFSRREIDLWCAAAGQLAVGVDNARLLREAQAALKTRDEFMSIASHELRTPLTPLKMSLYTMERKIALGERVALSTVLKAKRQVDRLGGLVNDLLDASRAEMRKLQVNRQPLELGQLVVEVAEQFRGAFERPLTLTTCPERLWVSGDRDRLEQVLVNLVENAQKYSPEGSPVSLAVEAEPGAVVFRVSDRGIGIPSEDQEKIFQRFHRAQNVSHRHFAGLGLGLYISESIVRLHDGALSVTSVEGQGSTFTVRLPRLPREEEQRLPRRVLLLEEHPDEREFAACTLRALGLDPQVTHPGEAMRNLALAPLDLMVVSATLDAPTREQLLQTLTAVPLAREIPLVFTGPGLPAWGCPEGAVVCPKPYGRDELGLAIQRALQRAGSDAPKAEPEPLRG